MLLNVKCVIFLILLFNIISWISGIGDNDSDNITGNNVNEGNVNNNIENPIDLPSETQSAQCTITAGDIKASAQATITKTLEGVCGSKEMTDAFLELERKLYYELYVIRTMIYEIQHPQQINHQNAFSYQQHQQPAYDLHYSAPLNPFPPQQQQPINPNYYAQVQPEPSQHNQQIPTTNSINIISTTTENEQASSIYTTPTTPKIITSTTTSTTEKSFEFKPIYKQKLTTKMLSTTERIITTTTRRPEVIRPQLKTLEAKPTDTKQQRYKTLKSGPRDFEIYRFNNTIMSGGEVQIFSYYWKIENYSKKLTMNITDIFSPIFTISGLHLRVKASLNHLKRDFLYLQIESLPNDLLNGKDNSNIILETGNMFKEIETKKLFKHKIVVLDQGTPTTDLISQEFWNTNTGFMIPNSAITSSSFTKEDSILIKVIIYL